MFFIQVMPKNDLDMKKGEVAGFKVLITGNKCYRCNYEWRPWNIEERPAVCPNCKSPYWWKPKEKGIKKK